MTKKPPKSGDRPRAPGQKERSTTKSSDASTSKETLRALSRGLPTPDDIAATEEDMLETSDRGAAIIAASMLERCIEAAIISNLPRRDKKMLDKMSEHDGALSSFYSKVHLGYAMGLYSDKILSELESIRKIRNVFAHSAKNVTFETAPIAHQCAKLRRRESYTQEFPTSFSEQRTRFLAACISITKILLATAALVRISRLARRFPQISKRIAPVLAKWEKEFHT
jgi:hypothetical protein